MGESQGFGPKATLIGVVASRALRDGASGVVRSVFERSFYAAFGDAWVCVGPLSLGAGPLNVLCAPAAPSPLIPAQAGIQELLAPMPLGPRFRGDELKERQFDSIRECLSEGEAASVSGGVLRIDNALIIDLHGAAAWSPPSPGNWSHASLARGLATFDATLPPALPREGLALLLRPSVDHTAWPAVARMARASQDALSKLVDGGTQRTHVDGLVPLLGLGPGLTPSGDDFIGGAMVALTCLGMNPLRDGLWARLAPLVETHTNDISRAHLAAAAEGYGSAALHDLLDAVIAGRGDEMPPCIATLAAVGHTSGWDAMAGAVTVLRAGVGRQTVC